MGKRVIIPLHGIRTHAEWQRAFVDVTRYPKYNDELHCVLGDWSFGHFPLLKFLLGHERDNKIDWFTAEYHRFMNSKNTHLEQGDYPSVVAHSFGTYIVGHALQRYHFLKFDKIIFCGSILPSAFDWEGIMAQGQVREVRNEYGVRDAWVRRAGLFINDAGSSGYDGFEIKHDKIVQEKFSYKHSQYFDKGHMERYWIPFLLDKQPIDITGPRSSAGRRAQTAASVDVGLGLGHVQMLGPMVPTFHISAKDYLWSDALSMDEKFCLEHFFKSLREQPVRAKCKRLGNLIILYTCNHAIEINYRNCSVERIQRREEADGCP